MIAALLLALAPHDQADLEHHLRNVYLERRQAFLAAWDAAGEERRELVRGLLLDRRDRGVPALYQLSAQYLTEMARVLEGRADAPYELELEERLACSLDVLVLPGAFGAGEEGRGEEVIARVLPVTTSLFEPLPEEIGLRLVWVGPEGREIPARREPVHRSALRLPGFEMYLRAPSSPPGRWRLVPEVELEGRTARGVGVPVDCVLDLFGRYDRLELEEPDGPHEAAARAALRRHLVRGRRDAMAPSIPRLLEGAALPPLLASSAAGADGRVLMLAAGPEEPDEVVVVVAPALEEADWVFAGEALAAWQGFAAEHGARVHACALPIRNPAGVDVLGVLDGLREAHPDANLTLIVRGRAVGHLALTLAGRDTVPFDRVVVGTVPSPEAEPRRQFEAPTLLLTPLFDERPLERVPTDGPPLYLRRLADPPVVVDRRLPELLSAFLTVLEDGAR